MLKWNTCPKCTQCGGKTKMSRVEYKYVCKKCNYILTDEEVSEWEKIR